VSRQRDDRRWRAMARQHDMRVHYQTDRARKERPHYLPAPVADFLRPGEDFCPGDHSEEQGCEGAES
jgi:hypothetical protein